MTLADYLAKKYLTADPPTDKKSKKRKRKEKEAGTVVIDDDAALDWTPNGSNDNDEDGPVTGIYIFVFLSSLTSFIYTDDIITSID